MQRKIDELKAHTLINDETLDLESIMENPYPVSMGAQPNNELKNNNDHIVIGTVTLHEVTERKPVVDPAPSNDFVQAKGLDAQLTETENLATPLTPSNKDGLIEPRNHIDCVGNGITNGAVHTHTSVDMNTKINGITNSSENGNEQRQSDNGTHTEINGVTIETDTELVGQTLTDNSRDIERNFQRKSLTTFYLNW